MLILLALFIYVTKQKIVGQPFRVSQLVSYSALLITFQMSTALDNPVASLNGLQFRIRPGNVCSIVI